MKREDRKFSNDLLRTLKDIERDADIEVSDTQHRIRVERRRMLPRDLVCPVCHSVKVRSRQWVVRDGIAVCRSCFFKKRAVPKAIRRRRQRLAQLPFDLVCPQCGIHKPNTRQWVVGEKAMCLSCWRTQ
jgi:rubredoxin